MIFRRLRTTVIALTTALTVSLLGAPAVRPPAPSTPAPGNVATADALAGDFQKSIQPFLRTYCISCHNPEKLKGDFDLTSFQNLNAVTNDFRRWEQIRERLEAGEMPPENAKQQPTADARHAAVAWIRSVRQYEAKRNAGDPGIVLARRLSNAEYDYTIRDLTGVDLRPTRDFPVDPANEAGFDNTGESLTMSPALVKKYLEAARRVSEHLALTPDGLAFAPHPVVTDTDRDKYCVNRIVAFYKRQKTDLAEFFLAAWRFKHRATLGQPSATLEQVARDRGISSHYLQTVWDVLEGAPEEVGPIAGLQFMWRKLPDPAENAPQADAAKRDELARAGCDQMRDFVVDLRERLVPVVNNLTAPKVNDGSQALVLWKDRQMAANRRKYAGGALKLKKLNLPADSAAARAMQVPEDAAAAAKFEATFHRFCSIFPDAFYISERARVYLDPEQEKKLAGRLLSAGFHSQMGYFRDDQPLYDLMLDDHQRRELDRLWQELDFIASAPIRQYTGFIWFDRTDSSFMRDAEFDFARAEDKDCISQAKVDKLEELYTAKAERLGASEQARQAMHDYFRSMGGMFRRLEKEHAAAEPLHLAALKSLAQRAYRRPLSSAEADALAAFYRELREKDGLTHEEAIRDCVTSVLMSPHFCYRLDLPRPASGDASRSGEPSRTSASDAGAARLAAPTAPLDDYALANRLSYFLWSSMPDQPLLDLAAAGRLHEPAALAEQARRMVRDDRARGLATEFAGNWLDFRRFEQHNGVDRERFPAFTNELRQAMFEEPIRFFLDVAQRDGSVLDFVYADHTFANGVLAKHYGMPRPDGTADADWLRIDHAGQYGRGGLLPMAVFLTNNSPGLRTSPVKRGNWVVKRMLGEHIPPPPAKVPELPADEAKLADLTLRETLARHRADRSCAACHDRFDSMGLVFEGYGPVGEVREKDLGGRAIDCKASFPGGSEGTGLDGLRTYVRQKRQDDFIENLCRKLLAYGLGRSLLPSDDGIIEVMKAKLASEQYRFGSMIETIVTSPQFRNKRTR